MSILPKRVPQILDADGNERGEKKIRGGRGRFGFAFETWDQTPGDPKRCCMALSRVFWDQV